MFGTQLEDEGTVETSTSILRKPRFSRLSCRNKTTEEYEHDDRDDASHIPFLGSSASRLSDIDEETIITRKARKKWSVFQKDSGQKKVVYDAFSDDPNEVMRVETSDEIPQPERSTDVVIKVQVRNSVNISVFSFRVVIRI